MCLMHLRYTSEVKILKIFTSFALSFISLHIFAIKTGGAIAPQPPVPAVPEVFNLANIDTAKKYLMQEFHNKYVSLYLI